jgi:hypothetical protein
MIAILRAALLPAIAAVVAVTTEGRPVKMHDVGTRSQRYGDFVRIW